MNKLLLLALLWPATLAAQPAPTVTSSLRTTSTATTSIRVGCTLAGSCSGGIVSGPIDVSSVTSGGFIEIANNVPASQTNRLVNNAGTIQWNGVALATGSSLSGTLNTIPLFTGASSVGNSIITQNVGATIVTVTGALNATVTLGGTLSTATQNSVTTMTGLTSVGTIATGTWNATIIGLAKGGTGVSLSGTGGTGQFLKQATLGGTVTVTRPAVADLSDASNVAVLGTSNTFLAGTQTLGTSAVGNVLQSGGTDTDFNIKAAGTGNFRIYTNGAARWGVNASGDWTFGAADHIADAAAAPASVGAGCGTGPTIVGTSSAFKMTLGTAPASPSCTVTFGVTFANPPICVATSGTGTGTSFWHATPTTTGVVLLGTSAMTAGDTVNVICKGY